MRRVIAIIAAIALAAVGTFLIVQYVGSAEERALEGEKLVSVLVVDRPIDQGTGAEDIAAFVRREDVPQKIAAEDAVGELADLEGQVATVDLVEGEQIIAGRFIDRETYLESLGAPEIPLPDDKLAVTISLDPERAVGGQLASGSSVAVIASFDPFDISTRIIEPSELTEEEILEIITAITEEQEGAEGAGAGDQLPVAGRGAGVWHLRQSGGDRLLPAGAGAARGEWAGRIAPGVVVAGGRGAGTGVLRRRTGEGS